MHTLDQVLLGTIFGFWCAAFCHIILRDRIYSHISRICHGDEPLTGNQALEYAFKALSFALVAIFTTLCVSLAVQRYGRIDIREAANLSQICNIDIPNDVTFISIPDIFLKRPIILSVQFVGLLSHYLG